MSDKPMTFDEWMKSLNPKYRPTDDSIPIRQQRVAWRAAQAAMKERCARVCEQYKWYEDGHRSPDESNIGCAEAIRAIGEGDVATD